MKRAPLQALKYGPEIECYRLKKMTYTEIANILGKKSSWVKALHYRWLKEQYKPQEVKYDFRSFIGNPVSVQDK